ncbi:tyrosine-type recombinase/integrase [Ruegeria arenilitoris]|uniref:tyrosine-type recombinase/integrase n=1 Tax=Ruegeria arenilitoris TaxID=1173585 RepID=UPI00147F2CB2|nr:site-specific integrase [Ruegeria arenilitoris]
MPQIHIGKLKGGYAVYWYENNGGKRNRRRFRLKATNKQDAWPEGLRIYESVMILQGNKLTFGDAWERYQNDLDGRRTSEQMKGIWKTVGPFFEKFDPLQIDDNLVKKYVNIRKKDFFKKHGREIGPGTLFHEVNMIQSTLNYAWKKKLISEEPYKLAKPSRPAPVDRWLKEDEIQRLLSASVQTPHLHVAIVLMLSTAGRVGAVLELTWDRIDFQNRTIDLRVEETGPRKKRAFVPMNEGTYKLLSAWKPMCDSEFVVEYKSGGVNSISNAFRKATIRAKLKNVTPHVLRHTAAVHMVASGSSMERVSQYLGHSSVSVTEKIYARFAPEHLKEESEAVDFLRDEHDFLQTDFDVPRNDE